MSQGLCLISGARPSVYPVFVWWATRRSRGNFLFQSRRLLVALCTHSGASQIWWQSPPLWLFHYQHLASWLHNINHMTNAKLSQNRLVSQWCKATCLPYILDPYVCAGSKEQPLHRYQQVARNIWCDCHANKEYWKRLQNDNKNIKYH